MNKKAIFIGFFVFAVVVLLYHFACIRCLNWDAFKVSSIKEYIHSFGPWAFVIFVALYTLNTVTLLPPIGIMSLSAGAIFGPFYGVLAMMLGAFLGTSTTFFISRRLGARFVQKIIKGKGENFQKKLAENGFQVVLFIRLIPVLPWEFVNYASGLSKIRYREYIVATLIGIFPAVIIQAYFSHSVVEFDWKDPKVYLGIGAFILLMVVPALYIKWRERKGSANEEI